MSRHRSLLPGVAFLLAMHLRAGPADASIIATVPVAQPIFAAEAGIVISTVTLQGHWPAQLERDLEVRLTVAPSFVLNATQPLHASNANAAAYFGLRVELPKLDWERHSPETLSVALIVPDSAGSQWPDPEMRSEWQFYGDWVVMHTAQCILINARRRWPEVRYVRLELPGARRWKKLAGLHSLANVKVPARALQLTDELQK